MPELPEVEICRRTLERHALGQTIEQVSVLDERILEAVSASQLRNALAGRQLRLARRHGKHLFALHSGDGWLHLHFGMTGDLVAYDEAAQQPRFARVVIDFYSGRHLAYEDARLFGRVALASSPEAVISERKLGPDPLDPAFDLAAFTTRVSGRRGTLKTALMAQEVIAGLGNLYVDEIVFRTSTHPNEPIENLPSRLYRRLYAAMKNTLLEAIDLLEQDAEYPGHYLLPRREEGARCPRCPGTIRKITVGGRSTYFCDRHQTLGRPGGAR
jgi:formamidopyrimidine-DNA glycosylase